MFFKVDHFLKWSVIQIITTSGLSRFSHTLTSSHFPQLSVWQKEKQPHEAKAERSARQHLQRYHREICYMRVLPTERHSNSHINLQHEMHFSSEAQLKPQLLSYSNKFYTSASASASGLPTLLSEHDLVLKCTERLNNTWWRGTPRQPTPPQLPLNAKQCTAEARIFCVCL